MMEMKAEMDQPLEKLEEACKQMNQAKAKETEMTNQLQDQAQKVQALFMFSCFQPHPQNQLLQRKCDAMETALKEGGGASDIKLDEILEATTAPPLLLHIHHLQPHPHIHQVTNQNTLIT